MLRLLAAFLATLTFGACKADFGALLAAPVEAPAEQGEEDAQWCCDPDDVACTCEGYWHCTEGADGRKRCVDSSPALPDDGGGGPWQCAYVGDLIVCTGIAGEHPDAGADGAWSCEQQGEMVECSRPRQDGDAPDDGGSSGYDCTYAEGGDLRECAERPEEVADPPPDDGAGCGGAEVCGDTLDNDCNGVSDCDDPACACGPPDQGAGEPCVLGAEMGDACADGCDNDGNGAIDCMDWASCMNAGPPENTEEACTNGRDDDCDWAPDCYDPDCAGFRPAENTEEACTNGRDDDCDWMQDCFDQDCAGFRPTEDAELACTDGVDNDCDWAPDCYDPECAPFRPGEADPLSCNDGRDNDCDGLMDCRGDPDCAALGDEVCPHECEVGECRWMHVCACCEDPDASDCPADSCQSPHLKWYSCSNGYWQYAGTMFNCAADSVPAGCDSIGF